MLGNTERYTNAALLSLIILQVVMLAALFAQTPPHPPLTVPPFAIGPFIGTSLCVAVSALILGAENTRGGVVLSILAALLALVSFGPQKYVDPQIPLIWPAVVAGQIAVAVILIRAVSCLRQFRAT